MAQQTPNPPGTIAVHANVAVQAPRQFPQNPVFGPGSPSSPPAQTPVGPQQTASAVQQLACTPPSAPNELVELARALKWNPDLIYEYVRNNIKTTAVYDSLSGPLGTLIDGAGSPVDQAELTYILLQQSCFAPQYQVGLIFLSAAQLDEWLGTTTNGTPNQFFSIAKVLVDGGFCTSFTTVCDGLIIYTTDGTTAGTVVGADVPWIWVSVSVNGTSYQYDPASKIFPFNGGDGYFPYSRGLAAGLASALNYSQSRFLDSARAGATGIGTPVLNFAPAGRTNVRSLLAQYANSLVTYIRGPLGPGPAASTTDVIGGSRILPLLTWAPPTSGDTLWGQTSLLYLNLQGIPPTTTQSLSAFRTTLTLTLGWNNSSGTFTQLANPVTFNSADIYARRLAIQFNDTNIASLLLEGAVQATASAAPPSGNQLTARVAVNHPHLTCASIPTPASCGDSVGPEIDNLRVTPAHQAIFVISNAWAQTGRGLVERHRKLLQQKLLQGQSSTSEAVLGESLSMIGATWLAETERSSTLIGLLGGTIIRRAHSIGITGMKPVGPSSQGPFVDLPLNAANVVQLISRSSFSSTITPAESSAFFTSTLVDSIIESATIEQTQPKDMNGVAAVAASTMKLLDVWSTAGTIYDLNDFSISGDGCSYYVANVKNNPNFTIQAQDKARIEALIGYSASTNTCSTPPSATQVVVPSNGSIAIGLWTGTGYLEIVNTSDHTDVIGVGAIITGGLSGGEPGSPVPPDNVNQNQALGPSAPASTDSYNNGTPSQIGNGNASSLSDNPAVSSGGSSDQQPKGGDPVNLVTGAYTYRYQDIAVGSGGLPYALAFVRNYDSALGQAGVNSSALGNGWMHNYDMTALPDSDGFEAMAENSPIRGAAGVAAIYVIQDILNLQTSNAEPVDRLIIAAQIARWLSDQSLGNIVAVTQAGSIERFTLLPNTGGSSVYVAPLGSSSQLSDLAGGGYSYRLKTGETLTFNASTAVASGRATSWNSPSGASVTFTYNSDGKLQSVANPATQRQLNLHYTNHLLTSVDDNVGASPRTIAYGYDSQSNLTAVTDALQQTTRFSYAAIGQLSQISYPANPNNAFVTTTYDSLGRASRQSDALGNLTTLFFAGARSETDDPAGTAHVSYFSQRGKIVASIEGLGSASLSNGAGNKTIYQYDGLDRLKAVFFPELGSLLYFYTTTNPLANNVASVTQFAKPGFSGGTFTSYTYDGVYNKVTSTTDSLALVTSNTYDGLGNLASTVLDSGSSPHFNARSAFTYNNIGQTLTATDPIGTITQFGYDGSGNLVSATRDPGTGHLNQTTSFGYNAFGDLISITDPRGNITTNTYDAARRLTATTAPNGLVTAYSYDPNGQLVQTRQSMNGTLLRSTSTIYSLTGKPTTAMDANGNPTTLAYDAADRVSRVTDPISRVTNYGYDPLGRQISISNPAIPGAPLLQKAYTPDGLLASLTDANNNTTNFAYDGLDRLSTTTYPLGSGESARSTETFTYDGDGNVVTRKTRAGATIFFFYDTLNRLATKLPPSPAQPVSYSYDLTGRLTGVKDTSATIAPAAPPGGTPVQYAATYSYDVMNRPTGVSWSPAPTAAAPTASSVSFGHSYNKANQRIGQTITDNSWVNYPAATPGTVSYTADALNRYTAVGAVVPTYDTNGNLTSDGTFTLGYDAENRLTSASGAGNTASYTYDAQGRRKTRTVNGATTVFVTDADNREVLEYGTGGAIQRWYAYALGPNDVLNQMNVVSGTRATLLSDIQGSIIASQDSVSGALTKVGYLPYGKSASTGPFGFTGQRIDVETNGLYYYRARRYSPAWGRFLQPDPMRYAAGANLYAYVGNDPLNLIDPLGLSPDSPLQNFASNAYNAVLAQPVKDVSGFASDFQRAPLDTISKLLNSFPQTRVEGELAGSLAAGATILQNAARGSAFEAAGIAAIDAVKNTTLISVPGIARSSIPDVLLGVGITEFKNAIEVNYTVQMRIQATYASLTGQPLNLVVSPVTQRVSAPLQQAIAATGGTIQRFDPATGIFSSFP
jgi:RHS repeat-associated protein